MNKKVVLGIIISTMFIASVFAITADSSMGNANSEKKVWSIIYTFQVQLAII